MSRGKNADSSPNSSRWAGTCPARLLYAPPPMPTSRIAASRSVFRPAPASRFAVINPPIPDEDSLPDLTGECSVSLAGMTPPMGTWSSALFLTVFVVLGGMTIAGGIAGALFARERTGETSIVDFEGALAVEAVEVALLVAHGRHHRNLVLLRQRHRRGVDVVALVHQHG